MIKILRVDILISVLLEHVKVSGVSSLARQHSKLLLEHPYTNNCTFAYRAQRYH